MLTRRENSQARFFASSCEIRLKKRLETGNLLSPGCRWVLTASMHLVVGKERLPTRYLYLRQVLEVRDMLVPVTRRSGTGLRSEDIGLKFWNGYNFLR